MDRNGVIKRLDGFKGWSLSARRAWIEMEEISSNLTKALVALRKESVDRNGNGDVINGIASGRSPQGERG